MPKKATRPNIANNPAIPLEIQRALRQVAGFAFDAQDRADAANAGLIGKVSKTPEDLLNVSQFVHKQMSAGGKYPLDLTSLTGRSGINQFAYIPTVNVLPTHSNPLARSGQALVYQNQLYIYGVAFGPAGGGGSNPGAFMSGTFNPVEATASALNGTRASRTALSAANYSVGTLFYEADTTLVYIVQVVSGANAWIYMSGIYARTQSQLAVLELTIGANDTGMLVNVTDYAHVLQWSGSAFGWGPGESGGRYLQDFAVPPSGAGWHACDGSVVSYLKPLGTTGTVTLPNTVATAAYRKLGATYTPAITAAAAPTVTPTGTIAATFSGTPSGSTNVLNTAGVTAVVPAPYTPAGTISATFTGASDTASLAGGDPIPNFEAIQYFRQ